MCRRFYHRKDLSFLFPLFSILALPGSNINNRGCLQTKQNWTTVSNAILFSFGINVSSLWLSCDCVQSLVPF